jgi:hypothetical protein
VRYGSLTGSAFQKRMNSSRPLCSASIAALGDLSSLGSAQFTLSDGDKTAAPKLFLVRHAEQWEGEDRRWWQPAKLTRPALARRCAMPDFRMSTQWRLRATAGSGYRITPEVIPVFDGKARENVEEVAAAVRRYKDETVLIVGHITVTGVIAALGGPSLPTICDNVFSDLFLFLPAAGEAGLIHLHYGAAEDISPRCRLTPLHD